MSSHASKNTEAADEYLKKILDGKRERRRERINLPFHEKIKIIVELQKVQAELDKAAGRVPRKPWDLT